MKKITPPARFTYTIEDNNYVLIKNKSETDVEKMEVINKTTYFSLNSTRYFKIKSHIIAISKQFEREDVIEEKLTLISDGLKRRLKDK